MGNMFRAFKDSVKGKELVIDNNIFVKQVLPGFVSRPLGEQAMAVPWYVKNIRNLETSFIGKGFHFVQEDQRKLLVVH